jgi:hypothetical protein
MAGPERTRARLAPVFYDAAQRDAAHFGRGSLAVAISGLHSSERDPGRFVRTMRTLISRATTHGPPLNRVVPLTRLIIWWMERGVRTGAVLGIARPEAGRWNGVLPTMMVPGSAVRVSQMKSGRPQDWRFGTMGQRIAYLAAFCSPEPLLKGRSVHASCHSRYCHPADRNLTFFCPGPSWHAAGAAGVHTGRAAFLPQAIGR